MDYTLNSFNASLNTYFVRDLTNALLFQLGSIEGRADLTAFDPENLAERKQLEDTAERLNKFYREDLHSTSLSSGLGRVDAGRGTADSIMWATVAASQMTDRVADLFLNSSGNHKLRHLLFALLAWAIETHGLNKVDEKLNFCLLLAMQSAATNRLERHHKFQNDQLAAQA